MEESYREKRRRLAVQDQLRKNKEKGLDPKEMARRALENQFAKTRRCLACWFDPCQCKVANRSGQTALELMISIAVGLFLALQITGFIDGFRWGQFHDSCEFRGKWNYLLWLRKPACQFKLFMDQD